MYVFGIGSFLQKAWINIKWCIIAKILIKFFLMFTFERERERERERVGEGQRERETQNSKQAPGSKLSAQSPTPGLNSRAARS